MKFRSARFNEVPGKSMKLKSVRSWPSRSTQTTFLENDNGCVAIVDDIWCNSATEVVDRILSQGTLGFRTENCALRNANCSSAGSVIDCPNGISVTWDRGRRWKSSYSRRMDIRAVQKAEGEADLVIRHSKGLRVQVPGPLGTLIYG